MLEIVYQVPKFSGENGSITVVTKVMKKDPLFIREAMKQGYWMQVILQKARWQLGRLLC